MATKSVTTKQNLKIEEFLRLGGTTIQAGFASKAAAATKSMLRKQLDGQDSRLKQAAKLYSGLKGAAAVAVNDPANKKALDELLGLQQKDCRHEAGVSPGACGSRRIPAGDDFRNDRATLRFCGFDTDGAGRTDAGAFGLRKCKRANQRQRGVASDAGIQWRE